jgi:hypothetical protein
MGIDVYLRWPGQTPEELDAQEETWPIEAGYLGYLRESYTGGPYATKILAREAFESPTYSAEIPSAVLRERLTSVTEPARGFSLAAGDWVVRQIIEVLLEQGGADVEEPRPARTDPQSVEEAIRARHAEEPEVIEPKLRAYRDFVALAERKEAETGQACTLVVDY